MDTAKLLRQEAVIEIGREMDESTSAHDFLDRASAIANSAANQLLLPFDVGPLPDLSAKGDRAAFEPANAIGLYASLGAMPKVAAADGRLWAYLAFGPLRPYMEARWALNAERNWKRRVEDRWLLKAPTTGALIRHGLARLWWLADLTYDPTLRQRASFAHQDEWQYLRIALSNEDRVMAIFDRSTGAMRELRFALLDRCVEVGDRANEDWLRGLMKEMTLANGYSDLSFRTYADLRSLIQDTDD